MSSAVKITALLLLQLSVERREGSGKDEDVRRGKVSKHPEISTDSDRARPANPCTAPSGTVRDNDGGFGK